MANDIYSYHAATIGGETVALENYRNRVLLIVNTASQCGFTPQLAGLEALHQKFQPQGFAVLGFPCNQFGAQDPGSNDEIARFCELTYAVSFPLFAKVDVNGASTHPLFAYLKEQAPGVLGSKKIKWNFTKFLIDRNGNAIERFAPSTKPEKIEQAVIAALD